MNRADLTVSVPWNLLLITIGSTVFSLGVNGVVMHNDFITSGIYGLAILTQHKSGLLSPPLWYFIFNIPLFTLGWFFLSRRFFFYSLYGVVLVTLLTKFLSIDFRIDEQIYAAIAGGVLCGGGAGITLRSLGSGGGLDIIAILLNSRYNIGVGKVGLGANIILFSLAFTTYTPDSVIASLILVFITSITTEKVISLFNQRKVVYIISDHHEKIFAYFKDELHQGATYIKAKGAFSGKDKFIIMAITNNLQLKKLESAVFQADEQALFIVENSFNVIGSNFGRRKIY